MSIVLCKPAFTKANSHLFNKKIWAWNLPAGHSCPSAMDCLAKADMYSGKITNGKDQKFKCYAAVTERFPSVRRRVWSNFEAVKGKSAEQVFTTLSPLVPKKAEIIRIHAGGDFFNQAYFDGWVMLAKSMPNVLFYAFTKSINYWVKRLGDIPDNMMLQAPYGGRFDGLIKTHNLKYALVVWSEQEAADLSLEIDMDDRLAAYSKKPFALIENFSQAKKDMVSAVRMISATRPD